MNLSHTITRLLMVFCIASAGGWSGPVDAHATQKLPAGLEAVARQFAKSYILGTGESHFLTSVRTVDDANAVAVVGSVGNDGRDPNAYTVYLRLIKGKWKVVKYDFIFNPTGKRESREQVPPFPYPGWEKGAP